MNMETDTAGCAAGEVLAEDDSLDKNIGKVDEKTQEIEQVEGALENEEGKDAGAGDENSEKEAGTNGKNGDKGCAAEEYKKFDMVRLGNQCGEPDCYYEGYRDGYDIGRGLRKGCSRKPQTYRQGKVLLKCSKPETVTVPIATETGTAFTVASLELDTSQFSNPCLQFEFTSNIVTTLAVLSIDFQIFRQCEDQVVPVAVSPVWRYSSILPETSSNTFSFNFCKCDECREKCCSYSVRVKIMGIATAGVTTIKNMTLSVFAADRICD